LKKWQKDNEKIVKEESLEELDCVAVVVTQKLSQGIVAAIHAANLGDQRLK